MKLYNAIAVYNIYVVAESSESAREALQTWIQTDPELKPSEIVATEAVRRSAIRTAWCEEKPIVANDIADADFKKITGKTTVQVFEHIYTK